MPTKWAKSPPEHIAAFDAALPSNAKVECRTMFGYPCAFVNGNMFAGLHEHNICARIGEALATERIASAAAALFAPMAGRVMREYVAIPRAHCSKPELLKPWLAEAFTFTAKLPPKAAKAKPSAKRKAK